MTPRALLLARVGAICWIVQLAGFAVEAYAVAVVDAPYSLVDNTLSDLGAVGCGTVAYPGLDVAVCSPAHDLFNASLLVGAVLLAVGALLLLPIFRVGRGLAIAGVVALAVAGLSGVATALVPIDVDLELHTLVSAPGFVAQPVGLLLLGLAARRARAWWGLPLALVGGATLLVGLFFVVRLDPAGGGLLERLVLWPISLVVGMVGISVLAQLRSTLPPLPRQP